MTVSEDIEFVDNPAIKDRQDQYASVQVDAQKILESWRTSLYALKWFSPEGRVKDIAELPAQDQAKRIDVESCIERKEPLAKPVLGIGLLENIEIGIGQHIFLAAISHGLSQIPVHIPKSNIDDFEQFLS